MEKNITIKQLYTVFEGELNPGAVLRKKMRRHCDGFVCFLSGGSKYVFDGYTFTANTDNFIYLAKGGMYDMYISEESRFICIDFDFDSDTFPRKSSCFQNVSPAVKNEFSKAFYTWNKKSPWYLPQTFCSLYTIYSEAVKSDNKEYAQKNKIFSDITDFVLKHYTEPDFSVKDISEYTGLCEVHVRRIFKKAVNVSPIGYINSLKLEKSKNMLVSSNYTVSEIAQTCGFSDPYYFSKFFRKEIGIPPSEYRKTVLLRN